MNDEILPSLAALEDMGTATRAADVDKVVVRELLHDCTSQLNNSFQTSDVFCFSFLRNLIFEDRRRK